MSIAGGGPFAVPAYDPNYTYKKVIIFLTDGLNTQNRWYSNQTSIDARSSRPATTSRPPAVTLYTIQVNTDGDPTSTLLQNCAIDPSKFFQMTSVEPDRHHVQPDRHQAVETARREITFATQPNRNGRGYAPAIFLFRNAAKSAPACLTSGAAPRFFTPMRSYLDFEKPVAELEAKIEELRELARTGTAVAVGDEISRLEQKAASALTDIYASLTPWQKTQVARHPQRPHCLDFVAGLLTDFVPFAGDRKFGDDNAIIGGFGRFNGDSVCLIGHEKGSNTEARLKHNFGMARPEGYRKAVRLMEMADRFGIPVIALVDTAGAYPGIDAEERGQAEAIARSTEACLNLGVPNIAVMLGEGGSGGAIAIATANRVHDAAARDLQRDLAGGRGLDPVARHHARAGRRDQHEDHRRGHDAARHHRRDHPGAGRRRASRSGGRHCRDRQGAGAGAGRVRGLEPRTRCGACGGRNSSISAGPASPDGTPVTAQPSPAEQRECRGLPAIYLSFTMVMIWLRLGVRCLASTTS